MTKNYSIGLDIGTSSVGWAVIDPNNFKVMRKGNKYLWGIRLFEEADTAVTRRLARGIRRRYDRRRQRIALLQEEFRSEIEKADPIFYRKLKETFFHPKDIENKTIKISKEEKQLIKKYYQKYPTIYHLRKRLLEDDSICDIRLVYLAIHHIIKYRGNFLYETCALNVKNNLQVEENLEEVFQILRDLGIAEDITCVNYGTIVEDLCILLKSDKKRALEEEFSKCMPKKNAKELSKLLSGDKVSLNVLFNKDVLDNIKISFKGTDYEDVYLDIVKNYSDEVEVLDYLKNAYDIIFLKQLLSDNVSTLSELMIKKYNDHKKDLKDLKMLLKKSDKYIYLFKDSKDEELCLYSKYVHNKINYDDFIKELYKCFSSIKMTNEEEKLFNKIEQKIKKNVFLPRITDVDNGKFPYQLNLDELKTIIEKQGKYYPFLLNKTNDGNYKLIKLLEFRIPYYVGPLNTTTKDKDVVNPNAWLIRKNDDKITPYNFNEVVDLEASQEKFIKRMVGHCTYLIKKPALPNHSILYSKFKVLNELKQIKVGELGKEEKLTHENQLRIYRELFLKYNGVITDSVFKEFLRCDKEFTMYDDISVIGYSADKKFANNMESYVSFLGCDGLFKNTNYKESDAENIIELMTVFEDKSVLKKKLLRDYKELDVKVVDKICSKKYKGWGNLSKELLTEIFYIDKETNDRKCIMDLMEETNENFMQILNNTFYGFNKKIRDYNNEGLDKKLSYDVVVDLVTSPANKRGIYQALKVVEEITKFMGSEPVSITLEMARNDEAKKRKDTRKQYLEKIYEANKNSILEYNRLNKELSKQEKIDNKKMFLYFIQEGKSLYSGTPLDITRLNEYEIDHIIPRSLISDDSIDNQALVLREENQAKAASFVVPEVYRSIKNKGWWQHLLKIGLISSKKYNNLIRYKFDEKGIEGFINRQLVETRQICKHVANILGNYYKKTKINYIPANLTHHYREKFGAYKFREINDYHHAHDAYLAAVLGEYQTKYLNKNVEWSLLTKFNKQLYDEGKYKELQEGYVINSLDANLKKMGYHFVLDTESSFDIDKFNETVVNTLYRNDIIVSQKTEVKTGEFYNATMLKHGNKGIAFKNNLSTELYGAYSNVNTSYAMVVKYKKKNKENQRLIGIPILIVEKAKKDISVVENYIRDLLNLDIEENIEIVKDKIPFNSLLNWDGKLCYLKGATAKVEVCNAVQFQIERERMNSWKFSFLRLFKEKLKAIDDVSYNKHLSDIIVYIIDKIEKMYPLYESKISTIKAVADEVLTKNDIKEKEILIKEMFKLLNTKSGTTGTANLKQLNNEYPDRFGRMSGLNIEKSKIMSSSVTGIWESEDEF